MSAPAPKLELVTAEEAALRLDRKTVTIRTWVTRFNARRVGSVGKVMYYDYADLAVIDREIKHGHGVPQTWQERAAIACECPLRAVERSNRAA